MKRISLVAVMLSLVMFSCKKSDKTCDLNAANLAGSYKISAVKYKADASTPEVDEFALYPACEKDDVTAFNTNGTYTVTDAGAVCMPAGNDNGVWSLSGNTINIDTEVGTVTYFDCKGMTITIAGTAAGELTTVSLSRQ